MNPYAPPTGQPYAVPAYEYAYPIKEGSYGLGIALGFIFGLWGLLGCLFLAKRDTKRGAAHGFLGRLGLVLLGVIIALLL